MFSDRLQRAVSTADRIGTRPPVGAGDTRVLLEKAAGGTRLDDDELVALLNGLSEVENRDLVLDFSRGYRRPRDREVLLLPPLYFSSICENKCAYCNFSSGGGVRLSVEEFRDEVDALIELGYRSIEVVSSQDPELYLREVPFDFADQHFDVSPVVPYFEVLTDRLHSNGGGMITSNIPPVCTGGFRALRRAGLGCFLVWLETFHPDQYGRLHTERGPKGHQAYRLDSFERAREAGVEHVAGAFLKGLYDWRWEEAMLYQLDRHLHERHGRGFSIIGSPRVKGTFTASSLITPHHVSDDDYEINIALDRVLFDGILWLQTRESFDFNRQLIRDLGGGVILTLTSCTAPGGYSKPAVAEAQFPVFKQNLEHAVAALEADGLSVRYGWTASDLGSFQRSAGS